jgi:hypothetical protein
LIVNFRDIGCCCGAFRDGSTSAEGCVLDHGAARDDVPDFPDDPPQPASAKPQARVRKAVEKRRVVINRGSSVAG